MKKIAVLFPGIGYTCDKPLLYYSSKIAREAGYEIRKAEYSGFPSGVKGNAKKMKKAADMALEQSIEILKDINWDEYEDILFLSKSVGTVVSSAYAAKKHLEVRNILYTPLADTFNYPQPHAIAFHGTSDPWAENEVITVSCRENGVPLYLTDQANHSLETGETMKDMKELLRIMEISREFICH